MTRKILIISEQSYQPINRAAYRKMTDLKLQVDVLVPYPKGWMPPRQGVFPIISMPLNNYHPRTSLLAINKDIKRKLIACDHLILESDLGTIMLFQIIIFKLCGGYKFSISILTLQNIYKNYFKNAFEQFKLFKLKHVVISLGLHSLERLNAAWVKNIFTVSDDSSAIHKIKFPNVNVVKIALGLDTDVFKPPIEDPAKLKIAFLGRVIPEKSPHIVLKIFEKISKKYPDIELVFQDPLRYPNDYTRDLSVQLEKIIKNGGNLKIVNPTHEQVGKILQSTSIIVIPSTETKIYKEQYGRLIVEAKLSKTIPIISDSGAFPEVLKNDALVVKLGDDFATNLEFAIEKIINMDVCERNKVAQELLTDALETQTITVQAGQLYEVLS